MPKLGRHAGRIEQQPEDLLIFEGETLLLSGYPVNDVRAFGGGRCSFEGSDVVFSSIDGSYPGDNKRRYSYFYRPLLLAAARFVGLAPQYLFFNLERDSRPAALREINSKVRLTEEQTLRPLNNPFENFIEDSAARRLCPQPAADSGEILLHTGYLYAGGAERQLCYLAARLKQRGFPVRVLTYFDCDINSFHYYPLLKQAGVPLDLLHRGEAHPDFDLAPLVNRHGLEVLSWINMLPREVADEVWSLFTELVVRKPKVLHCWLDQPNITGAIAGWLAGVPTVVLSTRNVNPTNFTYLDIPWYRQWYRILTRFPNVVLSGNSQAGIESYAGWIGIDADRFSLIHNGLNLEVISDPDPAQVERFRSQHRLSLSTPVIAGIFRISEEKRPLLFLQVVRELRRSFPDLRVFVAGIGPLEQQFTAEIARLGLENTVSFLGRREDVPVIISASSLLLLVSKVEGLPNVLMEAQYLRRPVVCTKAGGSGEIVVDGQTGCVAELDDFNGVVSRCSELLSNPEKRGKMGQAARKHIEENFSLDKMTSKSVQLYGLAAAEGEPGNEEKVNGPKSVSDPAGRYVGNLYR